MPEDTVDHDGSDDASRTSGRRSVLAALAGALAAPSLGGLAGARSAPETTRVTLDEPLGTSSPGSPIAPTDGFADTDWMTEGPLTVVPVTNLNKEGPGSFYHAMDRDVDGAGRIVVFEVGGVIDLEGGDFDPETDNMFVAGQTAPGPGITLVKGKIELDRENIFVQHIRSRVGSIRDPDADEDDRLPGLGADAIEVSDGAENVIVDHCTASWGTDENLSVGDTGTGITLSNNLVAHGLASPELSALPEDEHSNGTLVGHDTTEMAVLGNLYAHNNDRHPRLKGGTESVVANNVVYNYDTAIRLGDDADEPPTLASVVRNVYRPGENTPLDDPIVATDDDAEAVKVHLSDNVTQGPLEMLPDEPSGPLELVDDPPVWPEGFDPVRGTFGRVLNAAGARPARRTAHDEAVVRQTRAREGTVIDHHAEVGGFPEFEPVTRELNVPSDGFAAWLDDHTRAVELRGRRPR